MIFIKSAAVLGSGVMGSGIAAHLANAGIKVLLLDITRESSKTAIEEIKKSTPATLMHKDKINLITPGSFDTDLTKIQEVDWVIEAVLEDLTIKQALYAQVDQHRGKKTVVSSNTSTIPLAKLTEGRSLEFKHHFMITHFFNPPRYMRLLEVVKGPEVSQELYQSLIDFCDQQLGKGVVRCHDTPGFIANRIGVYWLQTALSEAIDKNMSVEEVDFLFSKPLGFPKTGVFGLVDLVGVDLIPHVGDSMKASLKAEDPYVTEHRDLALITTMIANGYTGRKGKGGFYRVSKEGGKKVKEVLNLQTGLYRPIQKKVTFESVKLARQSLVHMLEADDRGAIYTWSVLSKVLVYAAQYAHEMAADIYAIDQAMKLGYNWKHGPFELIDHLSARKFANKLQTEGRSVPSLIRQVGEGTFYRIQNGIRQYFTFQGSYTSAPRVAGVLLLSDVKLSSDPLLKNNSAQLWDIGEGVCCFEFTSKQNSIDNDTLELLDQSLELVKNHYKALVIHNEGENFSVGANLGLGLFIANLAMWNRLEALLHQGQTVYEKMKYSPFPVVTATSGMTLGGGCECALHSDAIQAHAETYIGLVEVGVGLIPGWGGCKEMLRRWLADKKGFTGPMAAVAKVFELIGTAQVAKSAEEARDFKILREADGITMNKDRLLFDAKQKALSLVSGYKSPVPISFSLPGKTALIALDIAVKGFVKAGKASPYDEVIAKELGTILSGGGLKSPHTEDDIKKLERDAFMKLIKNSKTLARIESIILTNKPLRN